MDDIKYETLVVNLKNLSLVGPNEKMVILEEKWIVVDKRYMQSFMRYWSGDNRTTLLAFIRGIVHDVVLCLKQGDISEDRRVKLMQLLPAVKAGLSNLRITYGDDRVSLFQLECLGDMLDLQLRDIGRILRGAARQKGSARQTMCGILYCQLDGQSIGQLKDRWKLIAHRGPDGGRCLVAHGAFWGFRRLSIVNLDVEAGMQPIEQNGSVLMCNGEIYNHKALRSREHQTDVAVITEVLDGVAMASHADICERLGRLDGDFALVYASADGQLLLTRDPVGVKPLYYAVDSAGRLVAAASEVKCMVGLPRVDKIHHVPPGSYIRGDDAQVRHYTEWRTKEGTNKADIPRVFREAVRKRLHHGDQPVALLCSGGLDSSVIVELAKTLVKDPRDLHAFSVQFEEGESLDTRYATDLLKELGIQHTVVTFTWAQVQECLCDVVTTCETNDMFSIVAAVPLYLLAKHIRENTQYRVILSGEGADEIFCGYQYFTLSPDDAATEAESQRLLDNIHGFDLLRTERCFSRHGLEIRVPYLDPALVKLVLNIPGFWRRPQGQREKGLLRDSFPLPALKRTGVLERLKMRLSDGCSFAYWGRIDADALESRCKQLFAEHFGDQTEWLLERTMPIWADKPRPRSGRSSMSIQSTLRTL